MINNEINIQEVLKLMRDSIGEQAQEIAVLKTVVATLNAQLAEYAPASEEPKKD
jgi:hypothetical protein